jgi:hypothetical protein
VVFVDDRHLHRLLTITTDTRSCGGGSEDATLHVFGTGHFNNRHPHRWHSNSSAELLTLPLLVISSFIVVEVKAVGATDGVDVTVFVVFLFIGIVVVVMLVYHLFF